MKITAIAPGKLILSGEHAVLYGSPALAMTINRYAKTTVNNNQNTTQNTNQNILFNFANLKYAKDFSLQSLLKIKTRVEKKYQDFLSGKCQISEVLEKPFELLQFTLTNFLEFINKLNLKLASNLANNLELSTESDIPCGSGMGSSAATILSVLYAVANFLNLNLAPKNYLELALKSENLQHGFTTGLDLKLVMQGGCHFVANGVLHNRPIPNLKLYIIDTGVPQNSTGVCVNHARFYFEKNPSLITDFTDIVTNLDQSFFKNNLDQIKILIRENHKLLTKIQVVPAKIQNLILEIEKLGGAAKICGAGAISGDNAGIVLVFIEDALIDKISLVLNSYQYQLTEIKPESRGIYCF